MADKYIDAWGEFMWGKAFTDAILEAENMPPKALAWLRKINQLAEGEVEDDENGLYWVILELAVDGIRWRATEQEEIHFSNN